MRRHCHCTLSFQDFENQTSRPKQFERARSFFIVRKLRFPPGAEALVLFVPLAARLKRLRTSTKGAKKQTSGAKAQIHFQGVNGTTEQVAEKVVQAGRRC